MRFSVRRDEGKVRELHGHLQEFESVDDFITADLAQCTTQKGNSLEYMQEIF